MIDFDNSPQKTFSFNPNTLNMGDPATTSPTWSYPTTSGGTFNGATPLDIVTKSAAAKSKADCYAAFPQWTSSSPEIASLSSSNKGNAMVQRGRELMSCLNQWNDYTPSLVRNVVKKEDDRRKNLDLRADFKVNREFTVYAKGSYNKRQIDSISNYLYMGDTTPTSLGYVTLPLKPHKGNEVRIEMTSPAIVQDKHKLTEVANQKNTDTGASKLGKKVLSIVEAEFYESP